MWLSLRKKGSKVESRQKGDSDINDSQDIEKVERRYDERQTKSCEFTNRGYRA